MKLTSKFRQLVAGQGCVVAPGCHDAMSARLIEEAGFPAAYLTLAGYHYSQLGLPHLGIATLTEWADHVHKIATAVDIPLIVDAEHGFGGPLEVRRAISELENAGASAVHIHDQARGLGWMVRSDDKTADLLGIDEMSAKIAAAVDVRSDPDFVLIGRTESSRESADEAVRRCNAWIDAGADLAMPMLSPWLYYRRESPAPRDELHGIVRKWVAEINAPIIIHSPFGVDFTVRDVEELGVGIWVISQASLIFAAATTREALAALKDGTLREYAKRRPNLTHADLAEIFDHHKYTELAQRFGV
jgi:2-methylisocitrate lyase-like PEP mutase family enzyme